jgi:hypothetical protein
MESPKTTRIGTTENNLVIDVREEKSGPGVEIRLRQFDEPLESNTCTNTVTIPMICKKAAYELANRLLEDSAN